MSTWQEQGEDSRIRLRAHIAQRFPGYSVRVNRLFPVGIGFPLSAR